MPAFRQFHSTDLSLDDHVAGVPRRPSGFLCCGPDSLELTTGSTEFGDLSAGFGVLLLGALLGR